MKLLILFSLLISSFAFSAVDLDCGLSIKDEHLHNVHVLITRKTKVTCHDYEENERYGLEFVGLGPGVQIDLAREFTVSCTSTDPQGNYFSAQAGFACGAYASADCGVAVGLKGACVIYGATLLSRGNDSAGIGAGAAVGRMKLTKY